MSKAAFGEILRSVVPKQNLATKKWIKPKINIRKLKKIRSERLRDGLEWNDAFVEEALKRRVFTAPVYTYRQNDPKNKKQHQISIWKRKRVARLEGIETALAAIPEDYKMHLLRLKQEKWKAKNKEIVTKALFTPQNPYARKNTAKHAVTKPKSDSRRIRAYEKTELPPHLKSKLEAERSEKEKRDAAKRESKK